MYAFVSSIVGSLSLRYATDFEIYQCFTCKIVDFVHCYDVFTVLILVVIDQAE